jgi:Co/Zn/Cd efflux system component
MGTPAATRMGLSTRDRPLARGRSRGVDQPAGARCDCCGGGSRSSPCRLGACVALYETIGRFINPQHLTHLWALAGVVVSAAAVAAGVPVADPLVGLVITIVILRITIDSWRTVRATPRPASTRASR